MLPRVGMLGGVRAQRIEPAPGQESVWDYPRPPRVEPTSSHVLVRLAGTPVADTTSAWRVLETSHPPVLYLPPGDVDLHLLEPSTRTTYCEFKGAAHYWAVRVGDHVEVDAAWSYPSPAAGFEAIADHLAFYPARLECRLDGERVEPQPGAFYGGWVTSRVVGPFKGSPGTMDW
jgi:uncharacterized protein (DUF427 family)